MGGTLSPIGNGAVMAICAKKKASSNKVWKLAGEPIYTAPLSG